MVTNETIAANQKILHQLQLLSYAQFEHVHRLTSQDNLKKAFDSDDYGDDLTTACYFAAEMHSIENLRDLRELVDKIDNTWAVPNAICKEIREHSKNL